MHKKKNEKRMWILLQVKQKALKQYKQLEQQWNAKNHYQRSQSRIFHTSKIKAIVESWRFPPLISFSHSHVFFFKLKYPAQECTQHTHKNPLKSFIFMAFYPSSNLIFFMNLFFCVCMCTAVAASLPILAEKKTGISLDYVIPESLFLPFSL